MAERPRNILICSCDDTMPLDGEAVRRVCKGSRGDGRPPALPRRTRPLPQSCRVGRTAHRRLHPGSAAVHRNRRRDRRWRASLRQYPRDRRLVRKGCQSRRPEDGGAAGRGGASRRRKFRAVNFNSEGVTLIYGKDERAIEAAKLLKEHLDVTVLLKQAGQHDVTPMRVTDFPVVKGNIKQAKGYLGAFELTVDDYAAAAPSSRGALEVRPSAQRRELALRHPDRSHGRRAAVSGRRSARRLSARRSGRSGRRIAHGA